VVKCTFSCAGILCTCCATVSTCIAIFSAIEPYLWPAQRQEPSLAGFVHSYVLMHEQTGLGRALASLLANKLASRTLLAAQLQGLFLQAYEEDEV
jgi:Serine acetyltransferase, N-terminal